ncbi:glycosyl transferase family 2 [Aureimonas leprariae]|nr:glycosyl transferase family 2 [Aureimonas leprariae]
MSVVIDCREDAVALTATLATLVPGAVEGLVREVLVVDRGTDAATRKVADHAGCRVVAELEAAQAVANAKGDWVMLIEPGARLSAGWIEAVAEHLADGSSDGAPKAARFSRVPSDGRGFLRRLLQRGQRPLVDGLVAPKAQAVELYGKGGIARRPAARRLTATIRPR